MASTDLTFLLAHLSVRRRPGRWCLVDVAVAPDCPVMATVVEDEGVTSVVALDDAVGLGIAPDFIAAWLTLEVESALGAVGLTAAVATALASAGIACNVLAGLHHDHLLVPEGQADRAIAALERLRSTTAAVPPSS